MNNFNTCLGNNNISENANTDLFDDLLECLFKNDEIYWKATVETDASRQYVNKFLKSCYIENSMFPDIQNKDYEFYLVKQHADMNREESNKISSLIKHKLYKNQAFEFNLKDYKCSTKNSTNKRKSTTLDVEKPKKPLNIFMKWSKNERKKIAAQNKHLSNAEISKLLGTIWKKMQNENSDSNNYKINESNVDQFLEN